MKSGQNDGSTSNLTLDVKVTTEVAHLLLRLTMLMQDGWEMKTDKVIIRSRVQLNFNVTLKGSKWTK